MNRAFLEPLLSGSGLLYLVIALLAVGVLVLRALSLDGEFRRRALVAVALLALFAMLEVALHFVPAQITTQVLERGGWIIRTVPHPARAALSIALLITGLLAFLLLASLLMVDFVMARKLRFEIPNILRDVSVFALFFVGVLLILYYRTDLDITGLFTTSAVISIVIGLALQDTLGNLFSGLALQTERSFTVGEWVRFGEREGVVVDISWRATKLRTRSNDLVIIPNSMISKELVVNYSRPSRVHAELAHIGVHYRHPPAAVIAALEEAADQTEGILKRPRVDVRTEAYGDFAITYEVKYWFKDYEYLEDIQDDFMSRVWYAFRRHGIEIPFPIRNVYLHEVTAETERAAEEADDADIYARLRQIELFDALNDEEARALAAKTRAEQFFGGETVVRQGDPGDSLYIIDMGRVAVTVSHDGQSEKVAELGPGDFVGEMALMTGEARTASVVTLQPSRFFVIDHEMFRDTLVDNPAIVERISETLMRRRAALEETHAELHRAAASAEEQKRQLLFRIRDFFGFGGETG